jgi:hypothetical protein
MPMLDANLILYATRKYCDYEYGDRLRLLDPMTKRLSYREGQEPDIEKTLRVTRHNIGMKLGNGLMVLDRDGDNQGPYAGLTSPFTVLTSRGEHLYFRTEQEGKNRIKVDGLDVDVLFNGTSTLPPSQHPTGVLYRTKNGLVRQEALPLFPPELLPKVQVFRQQMIETVENRVALVERARNYVAKMPPAVSGNAGHNATFRVACKLMCYFGLTLNEAWPIMLEFSERCEPPWDERSLYRKLTEAVKNGGAGDRTRRD